MMGKWLGILLAIMIACAVVGLLVSAVRALAGVAFVVCLAVLAWQMMTPEEDPQRAGLGPYQIRTRFSGGT